MDRNRSRREILKTAGALAGCSALVRLSIRPAAATPEMMKDAVRSVIGEAPVKKGQVKLDLPPLVENGNSVSCTVSVESPMTADDYVKAIHVFNEKNPQPNVISVKLGARAGRASFSTRIRLADSQTVTAIAELSDGSFWSRRHRCYRHARRLHRGVRALMARALIHVPASAKKGDVIEIKTLISHVMETGYRIGVDRQADPARHHRRLRLHL